MIINQSAVGMAARASRKTSYTKTNETLLTCLNNGNQTYYGNQFSCSSEEVRSEQSFQEITRKTLEKKEPEEATRDVQDTCDLSGFGDNTEKSLNQNVPAIASENYQDLKKQQENEIKNINSKSDILSPPIIRTSDKQKNSMQDLLKQLRYFLMEFRNRLQIMIGRRMGINCGAEAGNMDQMSEGLSNYSEKTLDLSKQNLNDGSKTVWNKISYQSSTYEESESMAFRAIGKAITADGRTLDFNVEIGMSREFVAENEELLSETEVILTDPLVINLDSNPISVSDQKWQFDIDGDGKRDSISLLSKGSGFLVFDKNNDGIINDGREMFGAKTGNGFEELKAYDLDGNGWIDEADEIYDKLKVWMKDDAGNDKMISLKQANVGAIYLGSASTEFALKSEADNEYNAQVRRTGVYLSESGVANSIQQLDMVKALVS